MRSPERAEATTTSVMASPSALTATSEVRWMEERSEGRCSLRSDVVDTRARSSCCQAKHLAERLNAAQVKLKRLNRLEAALVDFFLEVMDRSSSNSAASNPSQHQQQQAGLGATDPHSDSAFARQKRKEQFLRKADGDPIALLNTLRTHLRLQFATQCEQHQRLHSSLNTITSRNASQEESARHELEQLEASNDALRAQIGTLVRQAATSERERRCLDRQYKSCLEQLSGELQMLRTQDEASGLRIQQQQLEVSRVPLATAIWRAS